MTLAPMRPSRRKGDDYSDYLNTATRKGKTQLQAMLQKMVTFVVLWATVKLSEIREKLLLRLQ